MSAHRNGPRAWSQVLAAFLVLFCTLGLSNAFGVFQAFYEKHVLASHAPADIAWIGTTQGALLELVGFVSGPLYDKGYVRSLALGGAVLTVLGFVAASFAAQYYSVFLSLGVCVGLGLGILYVPSLAIVSAYFCARKRPLANGISAAGSSVGGIAYPFIFRTAVDNYRFGWACRIIALLNCVLLGLACALFKPIHDPDPEADEPQSTDAEDDQPKAADPFFDASALRDVKFVLFSVAMALLWLGVDVPFFYLPSFALDRGFSEQLGDYLVAALNAASLAGRVLAGLAAMHAGPPIAGVVLEATGGYAAQSVFAGSAYAAAFGVIAVVVWLHRRRPNEEEKGPMVLSHSANAGTPASSKQGGVHVERVG